MDGEQESLREWNETEARLKTLYGRARRGGWSWQAVGAASGLGGGFLAAVYGALLTTAAWVRGVEMGGLSMQSVGSALLLATLPLLIFGAHCLDLFDK